jgi:hypothetical protein
VNIDTRAVVFGAAVGLVIALPAGILGALVVSGDDSGAAYPFYILILGAIVLAGFVAGSKRPDAPMTHGAFAGVVAYGVAQAFAILVKAAKGDALSSPAVLIFNTLLMASLGVVGGFIAERRNARVHP